MWHVSIIIINQNYFQDSMKMMKICLRMKPIDKMGRLIYPRLPVFNALTLLVAHFFCNVNNMAKSFRSILLKLLMIMKLYSVL